MKDSEWFFFHEVFLICFTTLDNKSNSIPDFSSHIKIKLNHKIKYSVINKKKIRWLKQQLGTVSLDSLGWLELSWPCLGFSYSCIQMATWLGLVV